MHKQVLNLIHKVATDQLMPRFRRLLSSEVQEKGPGEIVTVADWSAEVALTEGLLGILPESVVVGEEASHRDPSLMERVKDPGFVWLVDPLDGTKHFAAGQEHWGLMVALLLHGQVEAAWIHLPLVDKTVWGRRGSGVFLNGTPVNVPNPPPIEQMRGAILTKFLPAGLKTKIEAERLLQRTESHHQCAAQRYVDLLSGNEHFALYYRTLAWDHVPGAFLAQQAGAAVHRFDGSSYCPGDGGSGLLVAANEECWRALHDRLLAQIPVSARNMIDRDRR